VQIIYVSRGVLLFAWLCLCPIFRKHVRESISSLCCRKKDASMDKFSNLLDQYRNLNSFLYSSLNMEIVCTILKGINVVLREINLEKNEETMIGDADFREIKVVKLKTIEVLSRKYFENINTKDLKDY
jgi:hypothetical protein